MSTFSRYTSEKTSFTEDELSQKAQNLSIKKEESLPKTGIVPDSLHIIPDGGFAFKFGKVTNEEQEWFDGSREIEKYENYTVVILESGHVALDNSCKKATENEIIDFIETHFLEETSLAETSSGENTLRKVEKNSSSLHAMYSKPASEDSPEKQKATDKRGLKGTDYHDEIIQEPLYKIKAKLPKEEINMKVGLDDNGSLTLYGQELEVVEELYTINATINEIKSYSGNSTRSVQTRLEHNMDD